jgi:hypothetical protein
MKSYRRFILLIVFAFSLTIVHAQDEKEVLAGMDLVTGKKDSTVIDKKQAARERKRALLATHQPRIATLRSALIPGWGQAYNHDYWKIPLVYGILAIPTSLYIFNNNYYKKTKFAYEARFKEAYQNDPSDVPYIDPELKNLSISSLQNYRNSFRRDRDYSILWFLLAWGLQVADATVFAHLNQFDVSNDLSMQLTPTFNPATKTPGFGITLNLKNSRHKPVISR